MSWYDPSTYTSGIATQLVSLLKGQGVTISGEPLGFAHSHGVPAPGGTQRGGRKSAAVIYLAMYGPQAGQFARAMAASQTAGHTLGQCFVDLAAQGPSFVTAAGKTAAHQCLNSGVPSSSQLPLGASYTAAYQARFHTTPGTWGVYLRLHGDPGLGDD